MLYGQPRALIFTLANQRGRGCDRSSMVQSWAARVGPVSTGRSGTPARTIATMNATAYLAAQLATRFTPTMCSGAQVGVAMPLTAPAARAPAGRSTRRAIGGEGYRTHPCTIKSLYLKNKSGRSISTGRQRLVSIAGSWRGSPSWFKAPCVITTIRPDYPWATTLTGMLGRLRCNPVSGVRPLARRIRLTRCVEVDTLHKSMRRGVTWP